MQGIIEIGRNFLTLDYWIICFDFSASVKKAVQQQNVPIYVLQFHTHNK